MPTVNLDVDGSIIKLEVDESDAPAQATGFVEDVTVRFTQAMEVIRTVGAAFIQGLDAFEEIAPKEATLTFGIKLNAQADYIIAKTGGEASFQVTLKWDGSSNGNQQTP